MSKELLTKYFSEGRLNDIITLFEAITDQRDRAELSVHVHLHTIKKLHESFSNITEPKTGRKISEIPTRLTDTKTTNKLEPKPKPSKEALDLDL